jgi:prepilin-type processing-associated H-X9-DG protein
MYSQDYDERTLVIDHTVGYEWFDPLQTYVKSEQMFKCPSMGAENPDPETDYSINALFAHSLSFAQFDQPANQIMTAERRQGVADDDYHCFYDTSAAPWTVDEFDVGNLAHERHNGGSNYSFADGHVKWLKWSQTLSPSGSEDEGPTLHNIDGIPEP